MCFLVSQFLDGNCDNGFWVGVISASWDAQGVDVNPLEAYVEENWSMYSPMRERKIDVGPVYG